MSHFEQLGTQRSRTAALQAGLLWAATFLTALIQGLFINAFVVLIAFLPLDFFGVFGSGSSIWRVMQVLCVASAAIGAAVSYPLAARRSHVFAASLFHAHLADPSNPAERRILGVFDTIGLAAGAQPIVWISPKRWLNVCTLGPKDGRPVIVVTQPALGLARREQETLAAMVLADASLGRTSLVWRATRAPGQLFRTFLNRASAYKPFVLGAVIVSQLPWIVLSETPIVSVIMFVMFLAPFAMLLLAAAFLWVLALAEVSTRVGHGHRDVADIGALSLLRDPQHWTASMSAFAGCNTEVDLFDRFVAEWVLPANADEANKRVQRAIRDLPGVRANLGRAA